MLRDECGDLADVGSTVEIFRGLADLNQSLRCGVAVVVRHSQQQSHDVVAHCYGQVRGHPKVDQRQLRIFARRSGNSRGSRFVLRFDQRGRAWPHRPTSIIGDGFSGRSRILTPGQNHEDISWMRIGVEVTAVRYLLQVRVGELVGQLGEVVIDPANGRDLDDLDALDSLGREDLVRGVCVDDARNQNVRKRGQRFSERSRIARLCSVIELVDQRALDLLHDADQIDARARRGMLG